MNVIECSGLTKIFSGQRALDNVDLRIGSGKIVGLLGPNGAGKTTLIKILNGLLVPTHGDVRIDGQTPGPYTKSVVSYLPDRTYFADWMRVKDLFAMFADFYQDFDTNKAADMCQALGIAPNVRLKTMSKGTKEKVQLIMVMSRRAKLYLLDEPIAGVDPAAREYILGTIINNFNEDGTVLISTHLISDVERVLDEVIFIHSGRIFLHQPVDALKEKEGKSVDAVFRDYFRMTPYAGYAQPQAGSGQRVWWQEGGYMWNEAAKTADEAGAAGVEPAVHAADEEGGETDDR